MHLDSVLILNKRDNLSLLPKAEFMITRMYDYPRYGIIITRNYVGENFMTPDS